MPDEPLDLERLSMFGFGAILPNLEASLASDTPLKRRLRPRRAKSDETAKTADAADLVTVNVKPRQRQKSSSWPPTKKTKPSSSTARQRLLKPRSGDQSVAH
ncbi:hypothetical protein E4U55_000982 [Claviceps digitariae]|nr:hypothetical protein E4U55_000982 [Claviceps digitariae]